MNLGAVPERLTILPIAVRKLCFVGVSSGRNLFKIHKNYSIFVKLIDISWPNTIVIKYASNSFVNGFDWRLVCVDYVLFHMATIEDGIDHAAHAGGFLFGYLIRDIVLYQKQYYY
jgi:hypothetical protein